MFERFTERARQVVVLAQEEARQLKHNYIGTEHILLGLLREGEGMAAQILVDKHPLDRIRAEVLTRIESPGVREAQWGRPYASRARRAGAGCGARR